MRRADSGATRPAGKTRQLSLHLSLPRQLLVLAVLFVCSLPLVTTRIYASDEVQYYAFLRSLWFDRDLSFENEYQHFYETGVTHYPGFHETFLELTTETGRRITFATIGPALLWSPFYGVADIVVHARRALGNATLTADGYSPPYIAAIAYGSALYGWLSLVLSLLIVRRLLSANARGAEQEEGAEQAEYESESPIPLIAVIAIWIGTPLFFYMYVAPPMAHACSAFTVAAFVLTWLHVRGRWSTTGLIALGALAALMAMVREQDLLIALGPALDWMLDFWRSIGHNRNRRDVGTRSRDRTSRHDRTNAENRAWVNDAASPAQFTVRAVFAAIAFGIAYLPQLIAYEATNGYPGPSRLVARKLNWLAPHALGVLLSPEHGLLFWTPLALLSTAGLILLSLRPASLEQHSSRRDAFPSPDLPSPALPSPDGPDHTQRLGLCFLLMLLSQIYVAGSVESWTVAGAFGQRRFVGLTSVFIVGLATMLMRARIAGRGPRVVCGVAAAVCVWWNLGLMAQFGAGIMDRQRLELGRNAYHTFITIPLRAPELAYRYLFERGSFYKAEPPHEP